MIKNYYDKGKSTTLDFTKAFFTIVLFTVILFTVIMFSTLISGCGSTSVNSKHILIETDKEVAAASVYFIRPFTYRERGIADNPVKIELNRKEIISLGKGEYTLVRIKPVEATITTRNYSMFTNKLMPIEMTRNANMTFAAGETYFIHIKQVNEEFRGVYYLPELIGLTTAKRMASDLKSTGVDSDADIEKL
ncbi:MAG: hypothetical protein GXP19_03395 [Gammaproteobacteria bacterium]|nr:hypothetical protein [Gammaproteobacteria bacterium]